MAYVGLNGNRLMSVGSFRLGGFGCGGSCGCRSCRGASLGETYMEDEPAEGSPGEESQPEEPDAPDADREDAGGGRRGGRGRRRRLVVRRRGRFFRGGMRPRLIVRPVGMPMPRPAPVPILPPAAPGAVNGVAGYGRFAEAAPAPATAVRPLTPWNTFVPRALDILKRQRPLGVPLGADQTRRLECLLQGLQRPGFDDRLINYWDLWTHQRSVKAPNPPWDLIRKSARDWLELARRPHATDEFILRSLKNLDSSIWKGIQWLHQQHVNLGSAMSPGMVIVKDWVARQQTRPNTLYSCYR